MNENRRDNVRVLTMEIPQSKKARHLSPSVRYCCQMTSITYKMMGVCQYSDDRLVTNYLHHGRLAQHNNPMNKY